MMGIFFWWFILSVVAGVIASAKNRSGFGYFVLSILLSPLIGLIAAVAMPAISTAPANPASSNAPTPETHVKCPECREWILKDARKCKHCGSRVEPAEEPTKPKEMTTEEAMAHYKIEQVGHKFYFDGCDYNSVEEAIRWAKKRLG